MKGARLACVLAVVIETLASAPAAFGDEPAAASESPGHALPPATDTADPCQDFLNILEHPDSTLTWDPILRRDFPTATASSPRPEVVWILANERASGRRCRSAIESSLATALPAALKERAAVTPPRIWGYDQFFPVLCSLHPDQEWAASWMAKGLNAAPECLAGLYEISERPAASSAVARAVAEFPNWGHIYVESAKLSPGVRALLARKLSDAYKSRPQWYRHFWELACNDGNDGTDGAPLVSPADCSRYQPDETGWSNDERHRHTAFRALQAGLIVLPAAGIVALDTYYRHDESGRVIATISAVPAGAILGGWLGLTLVEGGSGGGGGNHYGDPYCLLALAVGGIAGATAASLLTYNLTAHSPGGRVAATSTSMATISVFAISIAWD